MENKKIGETKSSYMIHALLYILLGSALAFSIYLNVTQERRVGSDYKSFDALPENIKGLCVDIQKHTQLKESHARLEDELNVLQSHSSKEIVDEMPSEALSNEDEEKSAMHKGLIKAKDFAKCYTMDNASYKIPASCKQEIISYVDRHQNAKYFEIIGIVDNLEFNLFNNLQNNKSLYKRLGVDQQVLDKMKKLTRRGLSKERASEASWVIKAHTNRRAATYNANYELVSEKSQRGVVVRAYE